MPSNGQARDAHRRSNSEINPNLNDLRRFERLYSLPKGRQLPSTKNISHHFRLIKSLKNGGGLNEGISIVEHKKTGILYVEKKLPTDFPETEREILFLNVLKHPNIIRYIDAYIPHGPHEGASLYVEYCELGTLQGLIERYLARNEKYPENKQARIPEPFIWHVLESMAHAFLYIHHGVPKDGEQVNMWYQIVHRDIKPDNIFLRKSEDATYPDIVLADFVSICLYHANTQSTNPSPGLRHQVSRARLQCRTTLLHRHRRLLRPGMRPPSRPRRHLGPRRRHPLPLLALPQRPQTNHSERRQRARVPEEREVQETDL